MSRGEFSAGETSIAGFAGTRYSTNSAGGTTAARISFANASHKVSAVGERDDAGNIETPEGTIRPSRLERSRADVSYAYSGNRVDALVYAGRLDTTDTGTPALPMDIRYIDTDLAGGHWSLTATNRLTIDARAAWNDVTHLMDNFTLREAPDSARYRQSLTTGRGTQLDLRGSLMLAESELSFGVYAATADHDATISNPHNAMFGIRNFNDVQRDVTSAFVEWTRTGVQNDFEFGLRAKHVATDAGSVGAAGLMGMVSAAVGELADTFNSADRDMTFTSADVVIKMVHHFDRDTEWRVELASKSRAPSYQELYLWLPLQATGGLADGRNYVGNLALDEERTAELMLGLGKKIGRLSVSPQVFYRDIDDYIQGTPSDNPVANQVSQMMSGAPALEFSNVDARIWGADIAWRFDAADHWFVDGSASYVRGRRTDTADNLYRLAPPNARVGWNWRRSEWAISADVIYYAEQDNVSSYNDEQGSASYALINATVTWEPYESLRLEASVENLLDRSYQDHLAGINRASGSDIGVGERLSGAARTVIAGLLFRF